jgi:zinc transporter 5/7
MFVELIYGLLSNSLSLISDSAHMLFDSSALAIGLYASFMSKMKPSPTYSYGFERFSTLSGFMNGLFLVFVAFDIFTESIERIYSPEEVLSEKMMVVSVIGLIINLVGLCFFHEHAHAHGEESTCSHSHSHSKKDDTQMK